MRVEWSLSYWSKFLRALLLAPELHGLQKAMISTIHRIVLRGPVIAIVEGLSVKRGRGQSGATVSFVESGIGHPHFVGNILNLRCLNNGGVY
jgi:hypothetical protein